jgi:hypothetical protein
MRHGWPRQPQPGIVFDVREVPVRKGILIGVVLVSVFALFLVSRQKKNDRPCRKLIQACQAAGYRRGHSLQERKSFMENCLKPLMTNASVGEIQIDPGEAAQCKAKFDQHHRGKSHDEANNEADAES